MIKAELEQLIRHSLNALVTQGIVPKDLSPPVQVTRTKDRDHGDFASNIALVLARSCQLAPRDLAELIVEHLPDNTCILKAEIAGPGFINFFSNERSANNIVTEILNKTDEFGKSNVGAGQRVLIEFVSANPTGPLHVGHGRGAAYGSALARLMSSAGFAVFSEYYVNDAGRQMHILAVSVWLRYLQLCGEHLPFPENAYQGDYIGEIAAMIKRDQDRHLVYPASEVLAKDSSAKTSDANQETYIDALIAKMQTLLGDTHCQYVLATALDYLLADIREDLEEFGVHYQQWFSERSLLEDHSVTHVIEALQEKGLLYEDNGARWFKSSQFGDEKDRVVVRENGVATYFATDIAYHLNKLERNFDRVIDIWGADHHGYVARIKASMQALHDQPEKLEILLVQFSVLYRGKEKVSMSTRSGEFVTLRDLRKEVGNDAARFFYILRKPEQHMDFDLELAKSQSNDNPVYYIQYAHARICSVFRQLAEAGLRHDIDNGNHHLQQLNTECEIELSAALATYPDVIDKAALQAAPHQLAYYARDLANRFHRYYNAYKFIVDDAPLRDARLNLILATQTVLKNLLDILGVTAPDVM